MSAATTTLTSSANSETVLTVFTSDSPDPGSYVVKDTVMGGRS